MYASYSLLAESEALEVRAPLHDRVVAVLNGFAHSREVRGAQVLGERRQDQNVVGRQLAPALERAAARQQVRELRRDVEHRAQSVATHQTRRYVHGDHDFSAHLANDVDGQVLRDAAVDEQAPVDLDRRERRRNRHARAKRTCETAGAEHHGLARHEVAGHGAKRNRELVEVVDLRRAQGLARDDHVDDLTLHEPYGQLELAVV